MHPKEPLDGGAPQEGERARTEKPGFCPSTPGRWIWLPHVGGLGEALAELTEENCPSVAGEHSQGGCQNISIPINPQARSGNNTPILALGSQHRLQASGWNLIPHILCPNSIYPVTSLLTKKFTLNLLTQGL